MKSPKHIGLKALPRCAGDVESLPRSFAARLEARHGDALATTHRRH